MIEDNKGKKIALLSASVLMIGFVLIRFLLFELHGMKQWPFILMLLCLVVIVISIMLKAKMASIVSSVSYIIGFFIGYFFQKNGIDNGGGTTNNLWIIWTVIIILTVLVSGIMEYIMSKKITK